MPEVRSDARKTTALLLVRWRVSLRMKIKRRFGVFTDDAVRARPDFNNLS